MTASLDRLKAAYEAAVYRVDEGPRGPFTIRCGELSPDADAIVSAAGAESWSYITAANPGSVPLTAADNAARMNRLETILGRRGLAFYRGTGGAGDASWIPEASLLVIGLDEPAALALAREFGQLAIVTGRRGEAARLAWTSGPGAKGTW